MNPCTWGESCTLQLEPPITCNVWLSPPIVTLHPKCRAARLLSLRKMLVRAVSVGRLQGTSAPDLRFPAIQGVCCRIPQIYDVSRGTYHCNMTRVLGVTLEHHAMMGRGGFGNPVMSSIPDTVALMGSMAASHLPPRAPFERRSAWRFSLANQTDPSTLELIRKKRREDGLSVLVVAS